MTKTREELRNTLRDQIGDVVRISGYATSGTNLTLVDTANLLQTDDYWNKQKLYILDTFDANNIPPMGEIRKIADFDAATNTLTVEKAFTDIVDAGDQYQIAVFSDTVFNQIISSAIQAYSKHRPYRSTGTFSTTVNTRRFSPPTGLDLRTGHRIDEIRYVNDSTLEDYPIYGWMVDPHQNKIDMGAYWSEAKTYTVFYSKPHDDFSSDSDTITIPDDDEDLLLQWCRAQMWLLMSREEFSEFGEIVPSKWTRGQISEDYSSSRKGMLDLHKYEMEQWEKAVKQHGFALSVVGSNLPASNEWMPPRDFRIYNENY